RVQAVIYQAGSARLGESRIHTGHRLGHFCEDEGGVSAYFFDRHGSHRATARGDVLVGADGIHSLARDTLYPSEGPARWNGAMLWRGAVDSPAFLTARSIVLPRRAAPAASPQGSWGAPSPRDRGRIAASPTGPWSRASATARLRRRTRKAGRAWDVSRN